VHRHEIIGDDEQGVASRHAGRVWFTRCHAATMSLQLLGVTLPPLLFNRGARQDG
jgi:hypothetical protein